MVRRLLLLSALAVALTTTVGPARASAATCTAALVADLPPPGPGGGDFNLVIANITVPALAVSAYLTGIDAAFSGVRAALPAGSQVATVNIC